MGFYFQFQNKIGIFGDLKTILINKNLRFR